MLAVRPPEYWPRLSFLALMRSADTFVLADTFQYSRQSFQNRARLRSPSGWHWITVPLLGGQHGRPIAHVQIDRKARWQGRHWRSLEFNYRSSAYFEHFEPALRPFFEADWQTLGDATCESVRLAASLFRLPVRLVRASALGKPATDLPGIVDVVGDRALIGPPETEAHDQSVGATVSTLHFSDPRYRQNFQGFEPGMSALDALFNYGPSAADFLAEGQP
jgi:hypothetical protein